MKSFIAALRFLTVLPIGPAQSAADLAGSMAYFPAAGLVIGILGSGVCAAAAAIHIDPFASCVMAIAAIAAITGGMHLDGLADTFDALLSGRGRDEKLAIMRDPHIGSMGVVALTFAILLKVSLLVSVPARLTAPAIILMCVSGRWSMVISLSLFPYARQDGKAAIFAAARSAGQFTIATVTAIAVAAIAFGLRGLAAVGAVGAFAYLASAGVKRKLGGITGDTVGAVGELSEVVALLTVCALQRSFL